MYSSVSQSVPIKFTLLIVHNLHAYFLEQNKYWHEASHVSLLVYNVRGYETQNADWFSPPFPWLSVYCYLAYEGVMSSEHGNSTTYNTSSLSANTQKLSPVTSGIGQEEGEDVANYFAKPRMLQWYPVNILSCVQWCSNVLILEWQGLSPPDTQLIAYDKKICISYTTDHGLNHPKCH